MSDGMGSDGDFEYGRPRYQPVPGPESDRPRQLGGGSGPGGSDREPAGLLAPSAVFALVVAILGLLLPLLGGIAELRRSPLALIGFVLPLLAAFFAIRRGTAALRMIESAGGELSGALAAVWARRLGWLNVLVSALLLFWRYGGELIQQLYSSAK